MNIKPARVKVNKREIRFGRHINLYGLLFLPDREKPTAAVVLCHGLGSNSKATSSCALKLAQNAIASLAIDFRGHGQSGGVLDGGQVADVVEAWYWISQLDIVKGKRTAIIGHSMGAGAAILAARELGCVQVLVSLSCVADPHGKFYHNQQLDFPRQIKPGDYTFEYPRDGSLPWLGLITGTISQAWMGLRGYKLRINWEQYFSRVAVINLAAALQEMKQCRKLIVHCREDKVTPYGSSVELYREASEPKELMLANKGYHSTPLLPGKLRQVWIDWVVQNLERE